MIAFKIENILIIFSLPTGFVNIEKDNCGYRNNIQSFSKKNKINKDNKITERKGFETLDVTLALVKTSSRLRVKKS